jgi:hypothetical protein
MHAMATGLAQALAAFYADLGTHADRVTLVTLTEFGRRVAENGSRGLDHGWGNSMLLMGAGVRGGRYYGTWPGLGAANLTDGDLAVRSSPGSSPRPSASWPEQGPWREPGQRRFSPIHASTSAEVRGSEAERFR